MDEKLTMQTKDLTEENVEKIAQLFPSCVTEAVSEDGSIKRLIDFEALKRQLSGDIIPEGKERYVFTWPGKSEAQRLANLPSNLTLRPCVEKSVNFDNTKNVYIEGDNLDALKLLRETYMGKVKMIYIDPPYNTGGDLIYPDKFELNSAGYKAISGSYDDEGNKLVTNSLSDGKFHTNWLNMMYPRLYLCRDFLSDDGVICIQIDDNEQAELTKICNEIFGEVNHLCTICVKMSHLSGMKMAHKDKKVPKIKEFILIYCKSVSNVVINPVYVEGSWDTVLERYTGYLEKPSDNIDSWYRVPLNDKIKSLQLPKDQISTFKVQNADRIFRTAVNDTVRDFPKDNHFRLVKSPNGLEKLIYNAEEVLFASNKLIKVEDKLVPAEVIGDIWTDIGINNLHKEGSVNFPNGKKPLKLLVRLLKMFTNQDSLIMDFFSGSASTGHAVYQLNNEAGGHRTFIMVQIQQPSDESLMQQGYETICDVGESRLKNASKEYIELNYNSGNDLDFGFRVYKIDSSNMNDVYYDPQSIKKDLLDYAADNIKSDRSAEDLLFQVMLELGIELSVPIVKKIIAGKEVLFVDDGYLVACFDNGVNDDVISEIAKSKPYYAVFRDSSMSSDSVAINFREIFKTYNPDRDINKMIKVL